MFLFKKIEDLKKILIEKLMKHKKESWKFELKEEIKENNLKK